MEYAEEAAEKAAAAELGHYLLSLGSSSLGSTHEEYFQKYQEHFDKYIKVQNKIASGDDYDKLKILDAVNTDKDKGYFKFAAPNFKINWIEGTQKVNLLVTEATQTPLIALLFEVHDLEETDKFGGIMTFLFPAICAIRSQDEIIRDIAKFIGDKSIEQVKSLQAESLTESIEKVDRNKFKCGIVTKTIFDVELKTRYDVAADAVSIGCSILIVEEPTLEEFTLTHEKILRFV